MRPTSTRPVTTYKKFKARKKKPYFTVMGEAVKSKNVQQVMECLRLAKTNISIKKCFKLLANADRKSDVEILKGIFRMGMDLKFFTRVMAHEAGDVVQIFKNGGKLNDSFVFKTVKPLLKSRESFQLNPLHLAILSQQVELVRDALESGVDANVFNSYPILTFCISPFYPLKISYGYNKKMHAMLKMLVEHKADPNQIHYQHLGDLFQSSFSRTPLNLACSLDDIKAVEMLVEAGADKNYYDENCAYPLIIAIEMGSVKAFTYLLDCKVNINHKFCGQVLEDGCPRWFSDGSCCTPLHAAADSCVNSHPDFVYNFFPILLERGAEVNTCQEDYLPPPLYFVLADNDHPGRQEQSDLRNLIRLCVEHGANLDLTVALRMLEDDDKDDMEFDNKGLLHTAHLHGNPQLFEFLLQQGLDPNAGNESEKFIWSTLRDNDRDTKYRDTLLQQGGQLNLTQMDLDRIVAGDMVPMLMDHGLEVSLTSSTCGLLNPHLLEKKMSAEDLEAISALSQETNMQQILKFLNQYGGIYKKSFATFMKQLAFH